MAYNEKLADRVRNILSQHKGVSEKKMFGGLCFMLHGNMCCGVDKESLMVRVGPELYEKMLKKLHARPMDITGRPLKGFVLVGPGGYRTGKVLAKWIERGVDFASSLPPKPSATRKSRFARQLT